LPEDRGRARSATGTAGIDGSDSIVTTVCGADRDTVDPAGQKTSWRR
jgi:hypothetical protein